MCHFCMKNVKVLGSLVKENVAAIHLCLVGCSLGTVWCDGL